MNQIATILVLSFLSLSAWSAVANYADISVCKIAREKFNKRFENLEKKYAKISMKSVSEENKPTWVWGHKKQAVYLLHGFIGTPEEMAGVAERLKQQNFTVINDLIPGYGADGWVANEFGPATWTTHIEANLNEIRKCFSEVHLIGFSTGGLLLHDYVRKHKDDFGAKSLILYSPFYKPHLAFADMLRAAARWLTPVALTKPLYFLTHFRDIKVAVIKPENYLQEIPLEGAAYVIQFGAKIDAAILKKSLNDETTPVLLFVSDADQIMNEDVTLKNVNLDFSNLNTVRFVKLNVPHHLMVDEVSGVAEQVKNQSVEFVLAH